MSNGLPVRVWSQTGHFPAVTWYKHVVPVKLGSLWWACISEIGTLLNQPQNTQQHSGENSLIHQRADKCDCQLITRAGENDTAMIWKHRCSFPYTIRACTPPEHRQLNQPLFQELDHFFTKISTLTVMQINGCKMPREIICSLMGEITRHWSVLPGVLFREWLIEVRGGHRWKRYLEGGLWEWTY